MVDKDVNNQKGKAVFVGGRKGPLTAFSEA